jgi:hypothetical protein
MTDASARRVAKTPTWVLVAIGGLFGLFYAYAVWQAVGNTVAAAQIGLNGLGWLIWIFAILFPVIVFAAAFALSYRRGIPTYALVLLTGLGLVAVFWLNVVAYTSLNTSSVLS